MRRIINLLFFIPLIVWANPSVNVWGPVADKVCEQINKATLLYKKNDIKAAKTEALMSYFKGYDAEIEPAVRVTLGGPHVFAIERKFRDFASAMISHPNQIQIQKVSTFAKALCELVQNDAKELNKDNVPRQIFKV